MQKVSVLLLWIAVVLSMLGGWSDLTGQRLFGLSRQHYWQDATFVAVLAIAIHLIAKL